MLEDVDKTWENDVWQLLTSEDGSSASHRVFSHIANNMNLQLQLQLESRMMTMMMMMVMTTMMNGTYAEIIV